MPTLSTKLFLSCSRNYWSLQFQDSSIPQGILRKPPESVKDLVSKLLPVHSCSVDTFIEILRSGCVKARSRLAPPRATGEELPSIYKLIMSRYSTHFDGIIAEKRCPWNKSLSVSQCNQCKEKIINLAEVSAY